MQDIVLWVIIVSTTYDTRIYICSPTLNEIIITVMTCERYNEHEWKPRIRDLRIPSENNGLIELRHGRNNRSNTWAFAERTARVLGISTLEVPEVFSTPTEKAFRINPLAFLEPDDLMRQQDEVLADLGNDNIHPIDWYKRAYCFPAYLTANIQSSLSGKNGKLFIQTPSSFLPVHAMLGSMLATHGNQRILDLCAAPGGKTSLLVAETRAKPNTTVVANDLKGRRAQKMHEVLDTLKVPVDKVNIVQKDGRHLPAELGGNFDAILVDAECSTDSGVNFGSKDPLKGWSEQRIKRLVRVQQKLAQAAFDGLAPGGVMVYSTCTLSPEENEGVIASLTKKNPSAIVRRVEFTEERSTKPIKKWRGEHFPQDVAHGTLRIFPGKYMDSFCVTVVHKLTGDEKIDKSFREPVDLDNIVRSI